MIRSRLSWATAQHKLQLFCEGGAAHISAHSYQMRSQLYQEEGLCSEQERLRNEISELTQELHQKEVTIATIMKKAALLERQLKIELEIKEKMLAKQQVCILEGEHSPGLAPAPAHPSPHSSLTKALAPGQLMRLTP